MKWHNFASLVFSAGASCPARGTWIEITFTIISFVISIVVPRKGHVD